MGLQRHDRGKTRTLYAHADAREVPQVLFIQPAKSLELEEACFARKRALCVSFTCSVFFLFATSLAFCFCCTICFTRTAVSPLLLTSRTLFAVRHVPFKGLMMTKWCVDRLFKISALMPRAYSGVRNILVERQSGWARQRRCTTDKTGAEPHHRHHLHATAGGSW